MNKPKPYEYDDVSVYDAHEMDEYVEWLRAKVRELESEGYE